MYMNYEIMDRIEDLKFKPKEATLLVQLPNEYLTRKFIAYMKYRSSHRHLICIWHFIQQRVQKFIELRKFGTWVKLDKITIPGGDIVGPDLNLENKEFIAVAEINNFEKIKLRCRIHHISQDPGGSLSSL